MKVYKLDARPGFGFLSRGASFRPVIFNPAVERTDEREATGFKYTVCVDRPLRRFSASHAFARQAPGQ